MSDIFFAEARGKHAPSNSFICERPQEIGANPALKKNIWKKNTTKMAAYANKVYVRWFVTQNMGMFILTILAVKKL